MLYSGMAYRFDTPIGTLALETDAAGLRRIWLPCELPAQTAPEPPDDLAQEAAAQITAYLQGRLRVFDLPLGPLPGTPLQQRILAAIASVPYGCTATYGTLGPARVAGHVCATNPLPLVIPCHRILPAHGTTTHPGRYRGGAELKRRLLVLETRHPAKHA